jgi:hypothetical protein
LPGRIAKAAVELKEMKPADKEGGDKAAAETEFKKALRK